MLSPFGGCLVVKVHARRPARQGPGRKGGPCRAFYPCALAPAVLAYRREHWQPDSRRKGEAPRHTPPMLVGEGGGLGVLGRAVRDRIRGGLDGRFARASTNGTAPRPASRSPEPPYGGRRGGGAQGDAPWDRAAGSMRIGCSLCPCCGGAGKCGPQGPRGPRAPRPKRPGEHAGRPPHNTDGAPAGAARGGGRNGNDDRPATGRGGRPRRKPGRCRAARSPPAHKAGGRSGDQARLNTIAGVGLSPPASGPPPSWGAARMPPRATGALPCGTALDGSGNPLSERSGARRSAGPTVSTTCAPMWYTLLVMRCTPNQPHAPRSPPMGGGGAGGRRGMPHGIERVDRCCRAAALRAMARC